MPRSGGRLCRVALHDESLHHLHLHILEEKIYHPANFKDLHEMLIEEVTVSREPWESLLMSRPAKFIRPVISLSRSSGVDQATPGWMSGAG